MNKTLLLFFFLLCVSINTIGQNLHLEKVSIADLEEKIHPKDTSAVAAVLDNKAKTIFTYNAKNGFSIHTSRIFRIKIYKKEGLKFANYEVPYRIGYEKANNDMVDILNCYTYNLENGKVVKTKLNNEGSFKTSINKYWREISLTMPNVKVGSIVEFEYLIKSENILQFPIFTFQQDIPVNNAEYQTQIPGFFTYKVVQKGKFDITTESKVARGSLVYEGGASLMSSEGVSFEQLNRIYSAKNIPALQKEPFVDNVENYRVAIFHELEKEQFNKEPLKDYSMTWEGVAKTVFEDKNFGKELQEKEYLMQDVKRILKDVDSQTERLEIVFKFVQNKMNWDTKKWYYVDKGVKQAYSDGIGNTAEINFILISMLNFAGIKTDPVLLSTIENGIPIYPNRTIFNYVIAAAEIDGKRIFLDATNKQTVPNILPLYALNWKGRLIRQDGSSEEINLHPNTVSKKTINMMASLDETGKLSGKHRVNCTDYESFTFREKYSGINQQSYLENYENEFPRIQISAYTIENMKNLSKPIIENFTFDYNNQAEIINNKMYIDPMLFFTSSKNPFVTENRNMPIYFGYPTQYRYNIYITIPDGYAVESLPKPVNLATGEDVGVFSLNISTSNNTIQIVVNKEIKDVIVSADFYPVLKGFYQQMIDKLNEKIILKKI